MAFVYIILWILKALWIILSETIKKKAKYLTFWDAPKFYQRFMYMYTCSSLKGSLKLTVNMCFKMIIRRSEAVFWCLEWEYSLFKRLMKID